MSSRYALACAAGVAIMFTGCATASPRQRPVDMGPVATGAGTMENERRNLQGRWTLVTLNVTAADGRTSAIDATGRMSFDSFGNLDIEYRFSDAAQRALEALGIRTPDMVISTAGSVAIDAAQHQIVYAGKDVQQRALGFDPDLAARRANPFTLERIRYYTFGADGTLTLTTRHDDGKDAAVALWKRS